jgi:hypothetical protein
LSRTCRSSGASTDGIQRVTRITTRKRIHDRGDRVLEDALDRR